MHAQIASSQLLRPHAEPYKEGNAVLALGLGLLGIAFVVLGALAYAGWITLR